jgi:Uma2 family endonuclease
MVALSAHYHLTVEEYLAFEETSPVKHEYIDGQVFAMAGTTDRHNVIAGNLYALLRRHLRGRGCRVYFADVKVRLQHNNRFYYPDLFVTCDSRDDQTTTYKSFPKLIIEVLSDGTEAFDRGDKFNDYQTLESLEEYGLVNSKNQRLEIFRRQENGRWQYQSYTAPHLQIYLQSLDLSLAIADVYEDVFFDTDPLIP